MIPRKRVKKIKTVLITGSSGFIGQKLCGHLFFNYSVIAFGKNEIGLGIKGDQKMFDTGFNLVHNVKTMFKKYEVRGFIHF